MTRSEWKGNSDHPYRTAPYNVQSVPAILLFDGDEVIFQIEDLSDFFSDSKMN